jgi:hypothetical protein
MGKRLPLTSTHPIARKRGDWPKLRRFFAPVLFQFFKDWLER